MFFPPEVHLSLGVRFQNYLGASGISFLFLLHIGFPPPPLLVTDHPGDTPALPLRHRTITRTTIFSPPPFSPHSLGWKLAISRALYLFPLPLRTFFPPRSRFKCTPQFRGLALRASAYHHLRHGAYPFLLRNSIPGDPPNIGR